MPLAMIAPPFAAVFSFRIFNDIEYFAVIFLPHWYHGSSLPRQSAN